MRVVFFGTPQFAVPTLEKLLAHPDIEVLGVVTQPDKRRGRGNQLTPSPVKNLALAHQLPVWQPARIKKDPDTLNQLRETSADVFVVVAYGQILSQEILDMPKLGCINVHGSILPKYRGAAPIQWCIYNGETETGITTMLMDAGMDTGAMLLKEYTPIESLANTEELAIKLSNLGADLLIKTITQLEKREIEPIPQDNSLATYAPLIKKEDYAINWQRSHIQIHNQVRGFFPDCLATFRDSNIKILSTFPISEAYFDQITPDLKILEQQFSTLFSNQGKPGEIVKIIKGIGPIVQTGDGLLLLREVQPAGKRPQSGGDFANGMRLVVGEVFGSVEF